MPADSEDVPGTCEAVTQTSSLANINSELCTGTDVHSQQEACLHASALVSALCGATNIRPPSPMAPTLHRSWPMLRDVATQMLLELLLTVTFHFNICVIAGDVRGRVTFSCCGQQRSVQGKGKWSGVNDVFMSRRKVMRAMMPGMALLMEVGCGGVTFFKSGRRVRREECRSQYGDRSLRRSAKEYESSRSTRDVEGRQAGAAWVGHTPCRGLPRSSTQEETKKGCEEIIPGGMLAHDLLHRRTKLQHSYRSHGDGGGVPAELRRVVPGGNVQSFMSSSEVQHPQTMPGIIKQHECRGEKFPSTKNSACGQSPTNEKEVRGTPGTDEHCLVATTGNEFSLTHSGTFHTPLRYSRRHLTLPEMRFRYLWEFGLSAHDPETTEFALHNILVLSLYNTWSPARGIPLFYAQSGRFQKKIGGLHFLIDFHKLNQYLTRVQYPLPCTEVLLTALQNSLHITSLDIFSGFYSIPVRQ
ncbi:hypothetical protein PR048_023710 [Dryococelus australis]|uniref:Reverse transcriptase domain-containing protein n=1 Tax=Dryococelus australis TaxID=614101 RepID=A0ABQ9GUU3_9NEOP|nr:hypothetical protein PR048_023710 [Dryococelus australis]